MAGGVRITRRPGQSVILELPPRADGRRQFCEITVAEIFTLQRGQAAQLDISAPREFRIARKEALIEEGLERGRGPHPGGAAPDDDRDLDKYLDRHGEN
jgi:hypothetical protein